MMARNSDIRIAKNTVIIYIRMAVTILVGLITSRLVLQALGASDVGIYSAVGSAVALVGVITGALTVTTTRFMNIEIGREDGNPQRMFNICHVVHLGGALVLLLLLETVGLWYIRFKLNVPPGKEGDAMFVFQVSTLVACLGIANVPFQSLFTVHEKFGTVAVVDIVNALLKLSLVSCLFLFKDNGLRVYALMMSVMTWVSFIVYHLLCRKLWPEMVRWAPVRRWSAYREVLRFSNYNLLSASALIARSQGSNMLINAFFGTTVNAAFFYAGTVQNYVSQFISNFDTAAAPQLTQHIGAERKGDAVQLAERVTRVCLLLFLLLFFPLWSELDTVLKLWLGAKMPPQTVVMCRWTLLVAAVSATSAGVVQLINGIGRIKWYKIEASVLFLGCLPVAYFLFKSGYPAHSVIVTYVIADVISRIIQFTLLHYQSGLDVGHYLREAYLRPALVAGVMGAYLFLYSLLPPAGLWFHLLGLAVTFGVTALVILYLGLKPSERKALGRFAHAKWDHWEWEHRHVQKIQRIWKKEFGYRIDWDHPRNLNEKIQWLLCFSDTREWSRLADKLQVRDFVRSKGFEDLLVPLLGHWERAEEIPWDRLPERFVLKCNHDSNSTRIVGPESDREALTEHFRQRLKLHFGSLAGETYYNRIPPRVLAEEYLDAGTEKPNDYKVWCLDGKPYCIFTCSDREGTYLKINTFHLDWTPWEGACSFDEHHLDGGYAVPRPQQLERMLAVAEALAEGFPEVRVDFYEVRGRLYFGEMTFASMAGRMHYFTPAFLREMGARVTLPC